VPILRIAPSAAAAWVLLTKFSLFCAWPRRYLPKYRHR